jgi:two-component system LytT family sensor kinase
MKNIKVHIAIWIAYFIIVYTSDLILDPDTRLSSSIAMFLTHNIFLFYSLLFVIRKFSTKSRKITILSVLRFFIVLITFFSFKYVLIYFVFPKIYGPFSDPPKIKWITAGFLWLINYSLFASAYFYFQSSIKKQKEVSKLLEEKLTKEKKNVQLENAHLRAQINPHFLFNTLGFLYNQANKADPELAEGIMALTSIMRSAIRKPTEDGRVPLGEEVESIGQLIRIYELRYNRKVYITFSHSGNLDGLTILPHVLITLVENALKHGDIHKPEHPLTISITATNGMLLFKVHNRKRFGPKDHSHGIGINYLQSQLQFAYKNQCSMHVADEELFYTTTLTIDIKMLQPSYLPLNIVV